MHVLHCGSVVVNMCELESYDRLSMRVSYVLPEQAHGSKTKLLGVWHQWLSHASEEYYCCHCNMCLESIVALRKEMRAGALCEM